MWQNAVEDLYTPVAATEGVERVPSCSSALWVMESVLWRFDQSPPAVLSRASSWRQSDTSSLVSSIWTHKVTVRGLMMVYDWSLFGNEGNNIFSTWFVLPLVCSAASLNSKFPGGKRSQMQSGLQMKIKRAPPWYTESITPKLLNTFDYSPDLFQVEEHNL